MTSAYAVVTADGLIKSGNGVIFAITLTSGSDAATLILYDEVSGSGDQVWPQVKARIGETIHLTFPGGLVFGVGCYAVITGTSPEAGVAYI